MEISNLQLKIDNVPDHRTRDGSFLFLFKRSFRYENDDEKNEKRNDRFLMEIVLKNGRFQNDHI